MATIQPGVYRIQNVDTGTVMEIPGGYHICDPGTSADGTNIVGNAVRGLDDVAVPSQLWVVNQVGGNVFTIENARSESFADLSGSNSADGTPIIGFHKNESPNQNWIITRTTDGEAFVMENQATGTFADLLNGNPVDGTPIQGWSGLGVVTTNPHQRWAFVRP